MKWTEPSQPKEGVSPYDHCILNTPMGNYIIEWKSWKDNACYDVMTENEWVGAEYDLETAKNIAEEHLSKKFNELKEYLDEMV